MMTSGIETNDAQYVEIKTAVPYGCAIGIDITNASDESIELHDIEFDKNTVGIELAAGVDDVHVYDSTFVDDTTNVIDAGNFDGLHFINSYVSHSREVVYPAAAGQVVSTGDGAWTWTAAATNIIPASTIDTPFLITGINLQTYDADQVFKIELFYGEATANISLGIFEFRVGDASKRAISIPVRLNASVPTDSIIGVKTMSSTAGVDDITITISYRAF